MAVPNTSTNVTFPKDTFEKSYDEVIVKGKAKFIPVTDASHARENDKKLSISVELTKEDFLALKKAELDGGRKLTGLKKVELPKKDADGNVLLDDEDEPIKEFSHYQVTFSRPISFFDKKKGETVYNTVPIKVKGHPDFKQSDKIGAESEVIVKGSLWVNDFEGKKQMGLNLVSIGVAELVEVTGGNFDPFAGMGFDDVPEATKGESKSVSDFKQTPPPSDKVNMAEELPEPQEDDWDDEVPF